MNIILIPYNKSNSKFDKKIYIKIFLIIITK